MAVFSEMKVKVSSERRRQIFLELEKLVRKLEGQKREWAPQEEGGEAEAGFARMAGFGKKQGEADER